jgi:preprotein translocase subunit SecG
MKILLLIIEFITALGLITAVLMHSAKGEGLGGIGGQARVFNTQSDMESGLRKFTTILAIVFVVSAGILGVFY